MPKINNKKFYPVKSELEINDSFVGSDGNKNDETVIFTMDGVRALMQKTLQFDATIPVYQAGNNIDINYDNALRPIINAIVPEDVSKIYLEGDNISITNKSSKTPTLNAVVPNLLAGENITLTKDNNNITIASTTNNNGSLNIDQVLQNGSQATDKSLFITDSQTSSTAIYTANGFTINNDNESVSVVFPKNNKGGQFSVKLPYKSGTIATLEDIPDVGGVGTLNQVLSEGDTATDQKITLVSVNNSQSFEITNQSIRFVAENGSTFLKGNANITNNISLLLPTTAGTLALKEEIPVISPLNIEQVLNNGNEATDKEIILKNQVQGSLTLKNDSIVYDTLLNGKIIIKATDDISEIFELILPAKSGTIATIEDISGGGDTPTLEQVLEQSNEANNKTITLTGNFGIYGEYKNNGVSFKTMMGATQTLMPNGSASGAMNIVLPANTGTLATLDDISNVQASPIQDVLNKGNTATNLSLIFKPSIGINQLTISENGLVFYSAATGTTTLQGNISNENNVTLTLPAKSGTIATIEDISGGGDTPTLEQVLEQSNEADDKTIKLTGNFSTYVEYKNNGVSFKTMMGATQTLMPNGSASGAMNILLPAKTGTLATLDDINNGGGGTGDTPTLEAVLEQSNEADDKTIKLTGSFSTYGEYRNNGVVFKTMMGSQTLMPNGSASGAMNIVLPAKTGTLATLDDISNGGGGTGDTPTLEAVLEQSNEADNKTIKLTGSFSTYGEYKSSGVSFRTMMGATQTLMPNGSASGAMNIVLPSQSGILATTDHAKLPDGFYSQSIGVFSGAVNLIDEDNAATYTSTMRVHTYTQIGNCININITLDEINTSGTPTGLFVVKSSFWEQFGQEGLMSNAVTVSKFVTNQNVPQGICAELFSRGVIFYEQQGQISQIMKGVSFTNGSISLSFTYKTNDAYDYNA